MRSLYFLTFSFFVSFFAHPQDLTNVAGVWKGTSTFLNSTFKVTLDLEQQANQLEGYVTTYSMKEKDSIKVRMNGSIEGNDLTLLPVEIIYKTGLSCASILKLDLSEIDPYKMSGRWKGDLSLKTCPPASRGDVVLYKERPTFNQSVQEPVVQETDDVQDDIGNALVGELNKRKYYALIIGIEEYQDEEIPQLDNPIDDGLKLVEVLTDSYSFDRTDMIILKNPKREEIIEALDELSQKVTEKDNLLIFYAGHGIWNEQLNQGYWLPSDASMDSKSFWLSNSTIRDYVGGIRSKHTLLISDACFSGGILKERAVFNSSRAILELYKLPSRKAMTSGTLKTVPDESVFIEYLIKNLKTNVSPLLSADQLFRNFKIAVINNSPNGQVPQYGPITQAGDEGGDFIFLRSN